MTRNISVGKPILAKYDTLCKYSDLPIVKGDHYICCYCDHWFHKRYAKVVPISPKGKQWKAMFITRIKKAQQKEIAKQNALAELKEFLTY